MRRKTETKFVRRAGLLVIAVAVALATVAPSAGSTPSVRGFDGTTIKVAGLGYGSSFKGSDIGTKARLKRANDSNEVKGINFEYTEFADDHQDPATATSEARRLVTQVGVFAIVPDLSPVNPGPYLNEQHVPYLGFAFDNSYCSTTPTTKLYGFGFSGCAVPANPPKMGDTYAQQYAYVAKKTGKKHPTVTIISGDIQSGKNSARFQATAAQGAGFDVVYAKGTVPSTTSDYSPYITEWLASAGGKQPDLIECLMTTQCIPVWNGLKDLGFTGTFASSLGLDIFAKPLAGTVSSAFYNTQDNPGLTQMKADFAAADAPATTPLFSEIAYFAADMFIQAVKAVVKRGGAKAVTPESVQKYLSTQTWQIKGLVGPVKYPASTVVPSPACVELIASSGTAPWDVVEPYSCSSKQFKLDSKFTGS